MDSNKYEGKPCKLGHTLRYRQGNACVECTLSRSKSEQYKQKNKEWKTSEKGLRLRRLQKKRWNAKRYGLKYEAYNQMLEEQKYCCAICLTETNKLKIDHNHVTGKVRGLLCNFCNLAIGMLGDDPERCKSAAKYLELNTC